MCMSILQNLYRNNGPKIIFFDITDFIYHELFKKKKNRLMVYDPSRANDQVLTKLTRSAVRSPFKLTCSAYSPFKCE